MCPLTTCTVKNNTFPHQYVTSWESEARLTVAVTSCVTEPDALSVSVRCQGASTELQHLVSWEWEQAGLACSWQYINYILYFARFHVDRCFTLKPRLFRHDFFLLLLCENKGGKNTHADSALTPSLTMKSYECRWRSPADAWSPLWEAPLLFLALCMCMLSPQVKAMAGNSRQISFSVEGSK